MRIAILSDFHFGFGKGSEREEDPYEAFAEAMEKAKGCDLILMCGDIFDTRNPDTETFAKAMELFTKPLLVQTDVKLVQGIEKDISKISDIALMGIPVVAIHGTHERRTKGLLNPVEALEKAGFLIYLHCNGVIFEKGNERIAVQGMSGVPDQYAEQVLLNWNPKPVHGCFNILLLHQSVSGFVYAPHLLELEKIPKGFDMYVNGHIHEAGKSEYGGKPFLLTGSLIPTQLKEESEKPKGFWIIDTNPSAGGDRPAGFSEVYEEGGMRMYWVELENQRRVYCRTFENPDAETIESVLVNILKENPDKKPVVRLDLKGNVGDTLVGEIEMKFGEKLILSLRREKPEMKLPARTLEEHKLSVEEMGRKILLENLKKSGLDPGIFENIFELLAEGKAEDAMRRLTKTGENETAKENAKSGVKQTTLLTAAGSGDI